MEAISNSEDETTEHVVSNSEDHNSQNVVQRKRRLLLRILIVLMQLIHMFIDDSISQCMQILNWSKSVRLLCSLFESTLTRKQSAPALWAYRRGAGLDRILLDIYSEHEFKKRMRVSKKTFFYLCQQLGPSMMKKDTKFRQAVSVEKRIMMALTRFATGDTLRGIADSYRVGYATVQEAVMDFANNINAKLKSLYISWPSPERMKKLAAEFELIHGIPQVIGAVDGSHIHIIAPQEFPQEYYNRKGFHSILLQLTVSRNCLIWDFDLGWPGSIHDWTMFQRSAGGQKIINGDIQPYCLVGDAAYPPRSYMLSPFKGHKDGLSREEYFWNYVQSSTRMPVEQAFGRLKARFRILLKRIDMELQNTAAVVSACLVLHNICIIHGDSFDDIWASEAKREVMQSIEHERELRASKRVRNKNGSSTDVTSELLRYCQYGLHRLHGTSLTAEEALVRTMDGQNALHDTSDSLNDAGGHALRRNAIANALFKNKTSALVGQQRHFNRTTELIAKQFGCESSDSEGD